MVPDPRVEFVCQVDRQSNTVNNKIKCLNKAKTNKVEIQVYPCDYFHQRIKKLKIKKLFI